MPEREESLPIQAGFEKHVLAFFINFSKAFAAPTANGKDGALFRLRRHSDLPLHPKMSFPQYSARFRAFYTRIPKPSALRKEKKAP